MKEIRRFRIGVSVVSALLFSLAQTVAAAPPRLSPTTFDAAVRPFLVRNCQTCHNARLSTAGLNLEALNGAASVEKDRDRWEKIVTKIASGEMPPRGVPRPESTAVKLATDWIEADFSRQDKARKPDPGRVIAHRLNRVEYANSIRDLLGVSFRAQDEFPADDSGYGFDNIGDVLTVSPTLMQKYLSAAERIATRAVGGDPLPKPGFTNRRKLVRRIDSGHMQLSDIVEYDAEYIVRAYLIGHRGAQDKPVTLVLSVDGKAIKTVSIPVQISAVNQQAGETQRAIPEARVFLPDGEHLFAAEFVNDEAVRQIPLASRLNQRENIYVDAIEVGGPFAASQPHPVQRKALICDPASGAACAQRILSTLARRAYRRPVTRAETGDLIRIFDQARKGGCTPHQSLQFAITSMLVAPQFLFRIENGPRPGTIARLSDIELASRLSFFLWSSIPDEELLGVAETNKLHLPGVLDAEVRRMLADSRASAFAENFSGQWLEIRRLDAVKPDPTKFPEWSPELKEAMATETRMFFGAVMRENKPISDFIDGKYTFVNELLAKHYGIPGITGPEFRKIDLTTDQRSGVFTHGSVLTVSSYPTRTSVVLRGKYLLENLLNAPPPAPPPDVPALNEQTVGVAQTLRRQMEQHRSDPTCASCHSRMDPLGFGLENYDAIGRWRTQDGKFPVDSSGAFPNGKEFSNPASMKTLLRDNMPEFTRCIAEKMLTYALGRGIEPYDRGTVRELVSQTTGQQYRIQSLILAIIHSAPFQQRRGEVIQSAIKTAGVTNR
jgi:mono/diheme cytochrome c family protein